MCSSSIKLFLVKHKTQLQLNVIPTDNQKNQQTTKIGPLKFRKKHKVYDLDTLSYLIL